MYPQAILLGLALIKRDIKITNYAIALSTIGGLIAFWHYYGQMFSPASLAGCAAGGGVDCAKRVVIHFGYITIPLMALSAFILIILLMLALEKTRSEIPQG